MEPRSQNFFQIFFHSSYAALHRATDNALVHILLLGNLAVALAEDQMRLHADALHLRQRVEGVPQVDEQLHAIQKLLRRRLMQASRVTMFGISVDEYFYPDMGADEAAKKRINIQLNSLNESELRLVEGIINAIIENRETEGA